MMIEGHNENLPDWLPQIVKLEDFDNDWEKYINHLYSKFKEAFFDNKVKLNNMPVLFDTKIVNGKEEGFWHIVTSQENKDSRLPDMRRCERLIWVRAILDNIDDDEVKVWYKKSQGQNKVFIFLPICNYIIVLREESKKRFYMCLTAFNTSERNKKKFLGQYRKQLKAAS